MSRAFINEDARTGPLALPELELGDGPNLVTQRGFDRISEKLAALETELAAARDDDLRYWSVRKASAQVVRVRHCDAVGFGCRVTFSRNGRCQSLEIVGEDEADPARARINWQAPLAEAILGAKPGETVVWDARRPPEKSRLSRSKRLETGF